MIRARQRQLLNTLPLPAEFLTRPTWWRDQWLQHYLDCPHVIRPGLTITFVYEEPGIITRPQTHLVIAVYRDYVWIRSAGSRPWVKTKREFRFDYYHAHRTVYDAIFLTAEEAAEIAFGQPFLDAGDPGGIWAAHLDMALDLIDQVGMPPKPIPSVDELPPGKLQTVEDGMGNWQTKFVIEDRA